MASSSRHDDDSQIALENQRIHESILSPKSQRDHPKEVDDQDPMIVSLVQSAKRLKLEERSRKSSRRSSQRSEFKENDAQMMLDISSI